MDTRIVCALLLVGVIVGFQTKVSGSEAAGYDVQFSGVAHGGSLILVLTENRNAQSLDVPTMPGETAQSVADRINRLRAEGHWFGPAGRLTRPLDPNQIPPSGGKLRLGGDLGSFAIAGTERGLGIPESPRSVSCLYNPNENEVIVSWENGAKDYGIVGMIVNSNPRAPMKGGTSRASLDMAQLGTDWRGRRKDVGDCDIRIVATGQGVQLNSPSESITERAGLAAGGYGALTNAPGIHLCRNWQEELDGMPFTGGIAPNWQGWAEKGNLAAMVFKQGVREEQVRRPNVPGNRPRPIKDPDDKPYYQIITNNGEQTGGIKRSFVGLLPRHTYRVYVRANTFGMGGAGNWELSIHAAYCDPNRSDLSEGQLLGVEKLPDGSKGEAGGRIALLGPSNSTSRSWLVYSTEEKGGEGDGLADITLPEGVTKLTVWLRCRGISGDGVGMDWLKLEDVTEGWAEKIDKKLAEKETK